jgi:hypothetical protein
MAQEYNRIMSADDILKQTIETRDERRDVPASDILTGTLLCLKFNEDWFPHIIGAVHTLQTFAAWVGDDDDSNTGTRQITKLLAQDMTDCTGDCPEGLTIPEIISDDTYFETEYVPKVFGEYYSNTVTEYAAQQAIYDDTPQSVAPDVPTSAPNSIEQNALCYAVNRFVELYASQKLCLIQSQNWLESLLSDFANAANDFYNAAADLMLPFYSANIFSCFVDDATAITALQDDAAIEELACYLYEELKTVTMSQANFDAAILDAATTLTGNAQDIACLLQNDNAETIFISFLLGYNIAIERQAANDDLECPCETNTYWMQVWDFANGVQGWSPVVVTNKAHAVYENPYFRNNSADLPTAAYVYLKRDFDNTYIIKACGLEIDVQGMTGVGSDLINARGWTQTELAGTNQLTGQTTFFASNGVLEWHFYDMTETVASHSYNVNLQNAGAPSGSNYSRINKVVIYGEPNAGQKPSGSVWVSSVPTSPTSLFP